MGETVTIWTPAEAGEDEYGDPVTSWTSVEVEGALVYETAGSDVADADRPDGVRVDARVQLPDDAMASFGRDALRGCKVALTGRGQSFDDAYAVVGTPNYAPGMPTRWNTTISLGRTDG